MSDLYPPHLVVERNALLGQLGDVCADPERYNSIEWFDCVMALQRVAEAIRASGAPTELAYKEHPFEGFPDCDLLPDLDAEGLPDAPAA